MLLKSQRELLTLKMYHILHLLKTRSRWPLNWFITLPKETNLLSNKFLMPLFMRQVGHLVFQLTQTLFLNSWESFVGGTQFNLYILLTQTIKKSVVLFSQCNANKEKVNYFLLSVCCFHILPSSQGLNSAKSFIDVHYYWIVLAHSPFSLRSSILCRVEIIS